MEEEGEVEEVLEMKDQSLANGEKEKEDTPVFHQGWQTGAKTTKIPVKVYDFKYCIPI